MSEELKPCPFCGERSITIRRMPHGWDFPEYAAQCGTCLNINGTSLSEDNAIKTWNTRAACHSESKENDNQTDLSLQDKLQSANAQIDTLVEASEGMIEAGRRHSFGEIHKQEYKNAKSVLAEAKKYKGEV